ncbi:MAG: SDR family oxidoreductase [Myxococcota bacterium]|jgi:NAD(P)-dependent dehydrogenase (short-subunit alcohol dehydrogenase family)|nr:SDR family oxidoreductase [Myxococcota bacterium]
MGSSIFRDDLFEGKVCLVTGGGTGIGAAIARELGRGGAKVIIASRKASNIEPAAEGLSEELGRTVQGHTVDIRDRDSVQTLVDTILAEHGRIDVLVNNGGGQFFSPAEGISPRGWDAVIATNLTGTWNMISTVASAWMLQHGGTILNITMLTRRTFPGMAHSVAARSGVEALTRTLSVEWAQRGIRINCIAPGLVASSGLRRYPESLGVMDQMMKFVPLKRPASCEEIAWTVAFLASPAGAYVTGQTWTVDGGKELWGDWWPIPDPPDMAPVRVPREPWESDEDDPS